MSYQLKINGKSMAADVAGDTPLLWVLRDTLNMHGTKYGCGIGQCGACTVLVDGEPVRSCSTSVESVGKSAITTIEGLSKDGNHPLQAAWRELDVPQCGYCQAGQILAASALLMKHPKPTDQDIDNAMSGNLCRCGTYIRVRKAIHHAAGQMAAAVPEALEIAVGE